MPTQSTASSRRGPSLAERTDVDAEQALAEYWTQYVEDGRRRLRHVASHRRESVAALRAVRALPVVHARPSDSPGGRAVRAVLAARASYGVPGRMLGSAVLEIPEDPDSYLLGRPAQTLRRKIRSAERQGLEVRRVEDPAERRGLVAMADAAERRHADPSYRVRSPHNEDLLDHGLWLVVDDPAGTPLLLSVTPVDGEFATLRYFRTLGSGGAHSDARYLATRALVAELGARGVRYLLDTATPAEQTNGLRHFQRMVGFRYARVRLHR